MESILESVKKMLGLPSEYDAFDADVIMHINAVLNILTQLGVGPPGGLLIEDGAAVWSDFMADNILLQMVKTYVYLKVRMMFDPPSASSSMTSMETMAKELEWRISSVAEGDFQ